MNEDTKQLFEELKASVSPYHCIEDAKKTLSEAGFEELELGGQWQLLPKKQYYVDVYHTTLVAFRVNGEKNACKEFRIGAAHTDWPCFRIKPNPDIKDEKYRKLNVEVYGGPIYSTWMDRPLSIAGRVILKGDTPFTPKEKLIDCKDPVLTIPNLAIHMNRQVNKGVELNPQKNMLPIISLITDQLTDQSAESSADQSTNQPKDDSFLFFLAKEADTSPEDILDYDLYIYNAEQPCLVGIEKDMISAPRLDNITSCQACLNGITKGSREEGIDLIALFDNEECGSRTKQGADSQILDHIMEKICLGLGYKREEYLSMLLKSFIISADVAHALHPNYPDKQDPTNRPGMQDGFTIKMESNQRYATDVSATAVIEAICNKHNITYKKFVNRSDLTGGSTLGSIISAAIPVKTADVGVPILAMHSARELMAVSAQTQLNHLMIQFFSEK